MTDAPTNPAIPSSPAPAAAAPPSPPAAAPAAASPPTPAPPTTPTASADQRPEWIPEQFYDAEKKEIKGADLRAHLDELTTFKAAEDSRKLTLPATPEAYELKLPETFTAPEGIEVKLDPNDPLMKTAREMAHAKGWSQADFSDALGVVAALKAGEAAQYEALKTANLAALGSKGPERIDAVTCWLNANFGEAEVKPVLATLATTAHVTMFEKIISKLSSQGSAPFSQTGRDVNTGKVDDATWDKMSYSEKKAYTAKHSSKAA
jgi:hypothetical protein